MQDGRLTNSIDDYEIADHQCSHYKQFSSYHETLDAIAKVNTFKVYHPGQCKVCRYWHPYLYRHKGDSPDLQSAKTFLTNSYGTENKFLNAFLSVSTSSEIIKVSKDIWSKVPK